MSGFVNPATANAHSNAATWQAQGAFPVSGFVNQTTALNFQSNGVVAVNLTSALPAGQNTLGLVGLTAGSAVTVSGAVALSPGQSLSLASPVTLAANSAVALTGPVTVSGVVGLAGGTTVALNGPLALASNTAVAISNLPQDASSNLKVALSAGIDRDSANALTPPVATVAETVVTLSANASVTVLTANPNRLIYTVQTTTDDPVLISESGASLTTMASPGRIVAGSNLVYAPILAAAGAITARCASGVVLRVTEYTRR